MSSLLKYVSLLGSWVATAIAASAATPKELTSEPAVPSLSIAWPPTRSTPELSTPTRQTKSGVKSDGKCIAEAANFHGVNASVLQAILMVESGMNPLAIHQNKNGTIDVGLGGLNSSHFREIAKFGIAPQHLLNDCVATFVTAWQLKKGITQFGNTWFGVAAYHSITPYYNNRYQVLVFNQLVSDRVLPGPKMMVPKLEH